MKFKIDEQMSRDERKAAAEEIIKYLKTDTAINPLIKNVLNPVLNYVKTDLCGVFSTLKKDTNRFAQVSEIVQLGLDSSESLENEKEFFKHAQTILERIDDKKSKLRNNSLEQAKQNEAAFMLDLEQHEPAHNGAVYGITAAPIAFGLLLSVASQNPSYFSFSLLTLFGKLLPATSYAASPSLLGQLVYSQPNLRNMGNSLNAALPTQLASRMLTLFGKSTNAALSMAENTAARIDNAASSQGLTYERQRFLGQNPQAHSSNENKKDTSYAARQLGQSANGPK